VTNRGIQVSYPVGAAHCNLVFPQARCSVSNYWGNLHPWAIEALGMLLSWRQYRWCTGTHSLALDTHSPGAGSGWARSLSQPVASSCASRSPTDKLACPAIFIQRTAVIYLRFIPSRSSKRACFCYSTLSFAYTPDLGRRASSAAVEELLFGKRLGLFWSTRENSIHVSA
jgi:hypothetical protein